MISCIFFEIVDGDRVIRCIRTDAISAIYRFEDMVFEGTFAIDDDKPIESGYKMLYQDDYDNEWRLLHVTLAEKDRILNAVEITAEHEFLHNCDVDVSPTGVDSSGFTFTYNETDTEIQTFVSTYLPSGWTLGDVSPQITESGGTVSTYGVNTPHDVRLALRKGPGFDYAVIKYYAEGTVVTMIDNSDANWMKVETPDGKIGWMWKDYLDLVSSSVPAAGDYTVHTSIVSGMTIWKMFKNIIDENDVIFTPRIVVDGQTITQYVDLSVGEPIYSGARLSPNVSLSEMSDVGDDSDMVTHIYPITSDAAIYLTNGAGTTVSQTQTTDTITHTERGLINSTRYAELGEKRVKVVQFDPEQVTSTAELQTAAIDYLIYYRDKWITVDMTASDLYQIGYNGVPIGYRDLLVAVYADGSYVTAMCSGLSRNYTNPEKTLVTIGTYRKDFALANAIVK